MNLTPEQLKEKMAEYVATLQGNASSFYDSPQEAAEDAFKGFLTWLTAPPPIMMPSLPLTVSPANIMTVLDATGAAWCTTWDPDDARLIVAAINSYNPENTK